MLFATAGSFQAGQLVGLIILVLVVVGLVRTFTRSDLTWKQKIFGSGRSEQRRGSN
jgi:BRCT domain type II-containing protein